MVLPVQLCQKMSTFFGNRSKWGQEMIRLCKEESKKNFLVSTLLTCIFLPESLWISSWPQTRQRGHNIPSRQRPRATGIPILNYLIRPHNDAGKVSPRNTPIAFAATTFPIELSAVGSLTAAILEANKSIWEVPKVTRVMAVTSSLRPIMQPNTFAKSLWHLAFSLIWNVIGWQALPDDDHHEADEKEGHPEAGPASSLARRGTGGEDDLEAEREKMHHVVTHTRVVKITTIHFETSLYLLII